MSEEFYLNKSQQRGYLVDAPFSMKVKGRGTGKTEGDLAPYIIRRVIEMPRSTRLLIAATFQQILTRTLPPLVAAWERMGYRLGVHYLIGQKPTEAWKKKWNWQGPYRPVFDYKHVIVWWNGTIQLMVSQERIGSSNGTSVDGIDGDEAKLLNGERLRSEAFPANRGPIKAFEGNIHHHGWHFTTDMPTGKSGRWILDVEKSCDFDKVNEILKVEGIIQKKMQKRAKLKQSGQAKIDKDIALLRRYLLELRTKLVHFQVGSSLDNIDALGVDYIRNMMRDLNKNEFGASILNIKKKLVDNAFYSDFDEEKHGYFAYDYHEFENIGYDFERLKAADNANIDADYNTNLPLHIGLDYNKRITPMSIAQVSDGVIRLINGIHSLEPLKLKDTLKAFCDYYKNHENKTVYYWFDHTTTNEYAHTTGTQWEEVVEYLRANDWNVIDKYIGKASGHERRFNMYGHLLNEDGHYPYVLRVNRERCKYLVLSINNTGTKQTKNGFGKDKSSELKENFPAEESTHYAEGLDMMIWGILESNLSFIEVGTGSGTLAFFGR